MSIAHGRLIGTLHPTRLSIYDVNPWCGMCGRDTGLVRLLHNHPDASAQTCWSAAVLWQMSRRPMTSVEGPVMDFTTAPGRWPEPSAHHDVHVDHGKDVGDERSARDSDRPWGVCKKIEHKIPQNDPKRPTLGHNS